MKIVMQKYISLSRVSCNIVSVSDNISFLTEDEVFYIANKVGENRKEREDRLRAIRLELG